MVRIGDTAKSVKFVYPQLFHLKTFPIQTG